MATSTIVVPDRNVLGANPQEICNKLSDVATAAKADIEGLTAASLGATAATQPGTASAGAGSTASKIDHVHPPAAQSVRFAADALAADEIAETVALRVKAASTLTKLYIIPDDALTADDTNYKTITVAKRDGAGGAGATVASVTTKITGGTGDWAAFTKIDMGALTGAVLAAGSILTVETAKTASGVALPGWTLVAEFG